MRQRVVVQGLVQKGSKLLVLRRAQGAPFLEGKYEIPGGEVDYGEQPEDAIKRHLRLATELEPVGGLQLFDVISYVNFDEGDNSQYVLIVYLFDHRTLPGRIKLNHKYNRYHWLQLGNSNRTIDLRYSADLLVSILQGQDKSFGGSGEDDNARVPSGQSSEVMIFADGGSRGNPGPSAAGYVVMDQTKRILHEGGSFIGTANNNYAEYQALKQALEYALREKIKTIDIKMDSMLVVNQINGLYSIKNQELIDINKTCLELMKQFEKATLRYIPRELNTLADGVVNRILDESIKRYDKAAVDEAQL